MIMYSTINVWISREMQFWGVLWKKYGGKRTTVKNVIFRFSGKKNYGKVD